MPYSVNINGGDGKPGVTPSMAPTPRQGIGLCLSGGGFRAALFHLGALRRLHEVGVLQRVRTLSCVSGGSILAGYLANLMIGQGLAGMTFADWERDVASGFRKFAGRDLRTLPMLAHLLWNWAAPGPRVRHLIRRYEQRLGKHCLRELPQEPAFVFCATDMIFGVNWMFRREESGDYQAGFASKAADWTIATAVGASACFPPLFGPMAVRLEPGDFKRGKYDGPDGDGLLARISLSDGGVYDNMALEPVWKSHDCVLVSDCGAPFQFKAAKPYFRRLMRYSSVVMNQAAAMRKRAFFADISERDPVRPRRYRGGYWGIGGSVDDYRSDTSTLTGYSQALVDEVIERIRTDLDAFTLSEMYVLENHGYLLSSAVLERRRPELLGPSSLPPIVPHPEWMDERKVRLALRDSHKRFSLSRLLVVLRRGK